MGDTWWRDWLSIVQYKRNIYGDLAEWQFHAVKSLPKFKMILRKILDSVGCEQVLFGSDAPCFESFISNQTWVDTIKSLSEGPGDCLFMKYEVEAILGGNATKILGI
jgi:predicted TIM-barrel fold metal-dependent hydrolase